MDERIHAVNSAEDKVSVLGCTSRPSVAVLMSTYNGQNYIVEQLKSIAAQKNVNISLLIRDDGSEDGTTSLIKEWIEREKNRHTEISLVEGNNIGYVESFTWLMNNAPKADYYAFSDQDDIWQPEKLMVAIDYLSKDKALPALYASSVKIVDENLKPLSINRFRKLRYSLASEIIRHRLSGHTMVWNHLLNERIKSNPIEGCWSHDQLLVIEAVLASADFIFDESCYVLHRRLESSVTPGGVGITKRVRHELKLTLNTDNRFNREHLASAILKNSNNNITEGDRTFLELCSQEKNFRRRISLICHPMFDCGLFLGNAEAAISVLLGRF